MDTNTHSPTVNTQNRKLLLITLGIFAIPFLAALLLHKTGFYHSVGTTNRGELITPPVAFEALQLQDASDQPISTDQLHQSWWMVYVIPAQCDQACANSLYQMRQIHAALGPEQNRVHTMLVATAPLADNYRQMIDRDFPQLQVAYTQPQQLQEWFSKTSNSSLLQQQTGFIYLVDTMGAVFMYYPTFADEQESILKGRDILKDLQKVLKLSKIG